MKVLSRAFLFILILLAMLGTGWLFYQVIFRQHKQHKRSSSQPTAILKDVTSINYNDAGQVANHLVSKKIIYFQNLDKSILVKPKIIIYKTKEQPWHIHSNKAYALNNNKTLVLMDKVKLKQPASDTKPASLISTNQLTVHTDKQLAETDKAVTYQRLNNDKTNDKTRLTIHAIGAKASQKTGKIKFLSHTHIKYEQAHS